MTQVLVRREGALGRLTLNRPQALNALSPAVQEHRADLVLATPNPTSR